MQNINLCIGLPSRKKFFLNFRILKLLLLSWVVLLAGIYAVFYLSYLTKSYTLFQLERKKSELNKIIEQKAKEKQIGEKGIALEKDIEEIKQKLSDKQNILSFFKEQEVVQFSDYLKLFSSKTPDDVWLKKIDIKPKKYILNITGFSTSPTLVVTFLHHLESDVLFKNYYLHITTMDKAEKNTFQFTIAGEKSGSSHEK